ncbi:MAG: Ig-like domain-containing protein [Acidobacteriales bacterium]|nr:Ig-like domain-containing protein [Terriglobales bacterium]
MRTAFLRTSVLLPFVLFLAACGGGGRSSSGGLGPPARVEIQPATLSLEAGQFTTLTAAVFDANNNRLFNATVHWQIASQNPANTLSLANVDTLNVAVCAGTWNAATNPTLCTPAGGAGTADVTVTAGSVTSTALTVNVHSRIANVILSAAPGACISRAATHQFTAQAFDSNATDITASVGSFVWASTNTTVASIATTGLVTGVRPGRANIFATVGGVNSLPRAVTTCPPAYIRIVSNTPAAGSSTITLAAAATNQLTLSSQDTNGVTIPASAITYQSSQPSVATVSATGLVTAVSPGRAAIVASCTPPSCNNGVNEPIYSNTVNVTVTGTLSSRVFVTGPNATTVVPIDTTNNVVGTATNVPTISVNGTATLPTINSFAVSPDGGRIAFGSNLGVLFFDTGNNTFPTLYTAIKGTVLAFNPAGTRLAVSDPSLGRVYLLNEAASGTATFDVPNASAAVFSPDGLKVFVVSGASLYVLSEFGGLPTQIIPLAAAANGVTLIPQGSGVYVAGGANPGIEVFASCNNSDIDTIPTAGQPRLITSSFDSSRLYAVDANNVYDIAIGWTFSSCPPDLTRFPSTQAISVAGFTPRQIALSMDGTRLFITGNQANVQMYNTATKTFISVPLLGAGATASTTGGVTNDTANYYVGVAGTNDVQRINPATGLVVQQLNVNLRTSANVAVSPEFVAVRPR